jgi:hypothetical protein
MRDGKPVTLYRKRFFFLYAIKYVTAALLVLSFQAGAAATQPKMTIAAALSSTIIFFLQL